MTTPARLLPRRDRHVIGFDMHPIPTPPRRRNAQIRTYAGLLRYAITHNEIDNAAEAQEILRLLQLATVRLRRDPRDDLSAFDVPHLVSTAHQLLGFSPSSLLCQKSAGDA